MTNGHALALLCALGIGGCAFGVPIATAAPLPPSSDPFYVAPPSLAGAAPGTILRTRQVSVSLGAVPLTGPAYSAYQLLYRTNDARDQPVANVTTVIVPNGAAPPGGRNLLSVQDAEDSLDSNCAPSYQLQNGQPNNHNVGIELTSVLAELAQGFDIVIPDAEGPQSQYIVTGMEGHATLDSIRAVERLPAAQVAGTSTPVGMVGYSGGAHETAAADELQPGYAPELNVVGVAAGGVPVGNEETMAYLDGSVGAGVLMATSVAVNRAFPELDLYSLLNARGRAFAQQVLTGCASSVFAAPFAHFDDWTTIPHAYGLPRVKQIVERNSLGHATPTAPTFYYNAVNDELVWIKPLDELVARYCAGGARIDYLRDPAGAEHIQGTANFAALATAYLDRRFAGAPVPSNCASSGNPAANGAAAAGARDGSGAAPSKPRCAPRRLLKISFAARHGTLHHVIVRVNGHRVKVARGRGRRLTAVVDLRRVRHATVVITARTSAGRRFREVRRYRICRHAASGRRHSRGAGR